MQTSTQLPTTTSVPRPALRAPAVASPDLRRRTALGVGLLALGAGAASIALLGPLVTGVLGYHVSPGATDQIRGGDVAALLLVAPVSVVAGALVLRRHPLGAALGLGPAAYGLYTYFQLATGGDPHRYPGNLEQFFPLLLAMFLLCAFVAVTAWRSLADSGVATRATPGGLDRVAGWFLLVVAAFLVLGLHLPGLLTLWRGEPTSEFLADPGVFWVVKTMDLGLAVPLLLLAGIGLVRRPERLGALRYAVTGWAALLGSSVAGMAVVMQASGDPAASPVLTVAFSVFAAVAVVVAVLVHRPLLRS